MVSLRSNALVFEFLARDRASRTFDKFSGKTHKFAARLGRLAKRAVMAATIAGAAFGTHAVRGFLQFDDAMNQSLAIMGDISGPMRKRMEAAARSVAKTTRFSASEVAEAFFFLASTGMDAEQSIAAIKPVAQFAQAGMFDLAKATELAVDAQRALGMGSQDAQVNLKNLTRVTDVLTQANVMSNATVEEFSQALTNKAAPALRAVNKPIEEGVAVLAALASQGLKGKAAGLALSITLRELSRRAITHEEAFKKAGIAVFDASGNMRNMADIVGDLERRFDGMSDKQLRAELMMLGFTDRSIQVILNLLGMSEEIRRYQKGLEGAAGATEEIANNQLKSFQGRIEIIKSHVNDFALTVGEKLVNALFTAGEKIRDIGRKLKGPWEDFMDFLLGPPARTTGDEIIPGTRVTGKGLVGNITALKPQLEQAWEDIQELLFGKHVRTTGDEIIPWARVGGGLVDQMKFAARDMIKALVEGFKTGDFGPIGEVIGEAIGHALKRVGNLAEVFLSWVESVDWVGLGIKAGKVIIPFAIGLLAGLIESLTDPEMWKGLGKHWQTLLFAAISVAFLPAKVISFIGKILAKIPFVGRLLAWLFEGFTKISKAVVPAVARFLGRMFTAFLNGLTRGGAGKVIASFVNWLRLFPTRLGLAALWVRDAALKMMRGLGAAIERGVSLLGQGIAAVIKFLTTPFRKAGSWLLQAGARFLRGLLSGITNAARGIGKFIGGLIKSITTPFRKAGSWLVTNGKALILGLLRGVWNVARTIGAWYKKNVIDRGLAVYKKAGTWLVQRGKQLINGLKNGVTAIATTIGRWLKRNVIDKVTGAFSKAREWLVNAGRRVINGLQRGISNVMGTISSWLRKNVRQKVIAFFGKAREWLVNAGKNLLRGLKNGMLSLLSRPVDFFKSVGNKIISGVKSFFGIKSPSRVFAGFGRNLIQGFIKGMITSGRGLTGLVGKVFGSMPKALGHFVQKGIVAITSLPTKAMKALEGLGGFFSELFGFGSAGKAGKSAGPGKGMFGFPLPRGSYRIGQGLGAGRGHTGQDFPAPIGTPVFAPFSGMFSTRDLGNRSYGKYANVTSGPWRFIGAHLSGFARKSGMVKMGELLGFVGSTGRSTGPHLHAEFRHGGKVIDPRKVLSFARGGLFSAGRWAVVGEEGPELVRFHKPGRVFNNRQSNEIASSGDHRVIIEFDFRNASDSQFASWFEGMVRKGRVRRA